jgi:hypothetical protein
VSSIQDFEAILPNFISIANSSEVRAILGGRCPQSVKTRWFSRSDALRWLLTHQQSFLSFDHRRIEPSRRRRFQGLVTGVNFEKLSMYHRPLDPCTQAAKFFERDHTSLCPVYTGLKALKRHFREQAAAAESQCPELLQGWYLFTTFLQLRQQELIGTWSY